MGVNGTRIIRMVAAKLIVSSSFEKSSFVYKTNLTVFVGGLTGAGVSPFYMKLRYKLLQN